MCVAFYMYNNVNKTGKRQKEHLWKCPWIIEKYTWRGDTQLGRMDHG